MEHGDGTPTVGAALDAVRRLDDAFDHRDLEGVMAAMTDGCVWIVDTPAGRWQASGSSAVRALVERLFTSVGVFTADEMRVVPGRVVVRWSHLARGRSETGTDVITIEAGRVTRVQTVLSEGSTLSGALDAADYVHGSGQAC